MMSLTQAPGIMTVVNNVGRGGTFFSCYGLSKLAKAMR
jgi:hypothetical protein